MEFQKALQDKLGEHEPIEVDELILDDLFEGIDTFTNDHKKSLELYKNLVHLSLNGLGLKSLSNFPKLDQLQILELRQNKLSGNDFVELVKLYPNLYKLKVGDNAIKSLDVFKPFSNSHLKKVELQSTEAANKNHYREELFKLIKELTTVDNVNKEGEEVDSTIYDEEGEEFDDDGEDGEFDDEELEDEEDFDEEDDDEEEDEKAQRGKKQRRD